MVLPHPDKAPKGTLAHREWLIGRLANYAQTIAPLHPRSKGFQTYEKKQEDPRATMRDLQPYPFAELRDAALALLAPPELQTGADVSGLDYDELADTAPTATVAAVAAQSAAKAPKPKPKPRPAEPREVLAARKASDKLKTEVRKTRRLAEELESSEARNAILLDLLHAPDPEPIIPREGASGRREAAAVVLCSDWHVEEVIDPATVEFRNAYGPDIARERCERMTAGILWLVAMHRERFEVRDLVLWLGGDMMSGYIHDELEETNALTPPETVVFVQGLIEGMIQTLLDRGEFERILVPCNVGNHGRTTHRSRAKTKVKNSYEFIIYHHLRSRFQDEPRVQFQIAAGGLNYLDVYDTTVRFHHGDDVKYYGGVGGLSIPLNKAIMGWHSFKPADLTCIGHFHQLLHGRDFVVNGSLVGYSEYALQIKAKYEPPQQAFFLIDKKRGRTCASPIWVEEHGKVWT